MTPELARLRGMFLQRQYNDVLQQCNTPTQLSEDGSALCWTLIPASLLVLGRGEEATNYITALCGDMLRTDASPDARAAIVLGTLMWTVQANGQGTFRIDNPQIQAFVTKHAAICQVSIDQVSDLNRRMSHPQ